MADPVETFPDGSSPVDDRNTLIETARKKARERFRERLNAGGKVAGCECESDDLASGPSRRVAGVRFLDSGQTYFFDPVAFDLSVGDWVVVETNRGFEAARVVISPNQMLQASLSGELKPIQKVLGEADIERMQSLKREAAKAVKVFGSRIRERNLPMKPISAEYNFDGTHLLLNFTAPDRVDFRDLARDLGAHFHCRVELRQVGPRDEARLLGGVGRCGRTLCCASWLPVFPEVSMNMA
jgi:cell fate regulator YaaT (PSP1 superfamily)